MCYYEKIRKQVASPDGTNKMSIKNLHISRNGIEAQTGFEPVNTSFADWRVSRFTTGPFLTRCTSQQNGNEYYYRFMSQNQCKDSYFFFFLRIFCEKYHQYFGVIFAP